MKKILSTLLISSVVFGGAQAVMAQDIVGATDADITVNGTLGADNTDPGSTIPEKDIDWINVTVPTDTIFYNKVSEPAIKAATYDIVNHSGRPVMVSVNRFVDAAGVTNPTLPNDFDLNLDVTGNNVTAASTKLIDQGVLNKPTNELITLANGVDQYTKNDTAVAASSAMNNKATFTYSGTATASTPLKLGYTLSLRFDSVAF